MCAASAASAPLCARPRALPGSTAAFPDLALATSCPHHIVRGLPEPCFTAESKGFEVNIKLSKVSKLYINPI
jgi:hypothetical protein